MAAAFARWVWLTEQRAFAPRLTKIAASRAIDALAYNEITEEAASTLVETLGEEPE